MTRYAHLSRPPSPWKDAGTCKRCMHTLWRSVADGALRAKLTMSTICRRRPRKHEAKP